MPVLELTWIPRQVILPEGGSDSLLLMGSHNSTKIFFKDK